MIVTPSPSPSGAALSRGLTTCSCGGDHFVQFYDTDEYLVEKVGKFVADGMRRGGRGLLIATPEHIAGVDRYLLDAGMPAVALSEQGHYVRLDAATTLQQFYLEGQLDEQRFQEVVGPIVQSLTESGHELSAFGEMVALLWQEGKMEEAIRLEEFWNRLRATRRFTLFCAYPLRGFTAPEPAAHFSEICRTHQRVLPTEAFQPQIGLGERQLREIASLQQRAAALEAEMAERVRVEQKLRQRESELTAFVESATIGLHWIDAAGRILWANPAEVELLGYTRDEYVGRNISEFHADPAQVEAMLARLSRGEKLKDHEARLRCKDGSIKTVLIDSSVLWDNGRFVHTQCFTRDITEQRRASSELARSHHALEERVQERTASLTDLLSQVEAFSYTVSHDLRAPVRAVAGFAEALQADYGASLDEQGVQYIDRILRASERMDRLINDVLAYARVNRERLDLKPLRLAESIAHVIQHLAETQSRPPKITVQPDAPAVQANETFLTQILVNLLSNALKFVAPGREPEIAISFRSEGDFVRTEIRDHGIGVTAAQQARLFHLFERLHPNQRYQGTGIGLAIVKRAVERMGGAVGVESDGVNGSCFWFQLRRAEAQA